MAADDGLGVRRGAGPGSRDGGAGDARTGDGACRGRPAARRLNTAIAETPAGNQPWGIAALNIPEQQTAIVSLGDSYISGEAGRWAGNAVPLIPGGDRWGTGRAAINCAADGSPCDYDGTRVYGESFDNGCNRSDSAEIRGAVIDVGLRLNLACSGARTIIEAGLTQTRPNIVKVVEQVRQTMTASGYADGSYRFVLQSYPTPIPAGVDYRYGPLGLKRTTQGGCPMWNDDSNWARDTVLPEISAMLKGVAQDAGIDYLELRTLFAGHEVCAKTANQATKANSQSNPLLGKDAEWVRFLTQMESQGQAQESIHPDYFGQIALGACLTKVYASPANAKNHACTNVPGTGPSMVNLASTPWPAG